MTAVLSLTSLLLAAGCQSPTFEPGIEAVRQAAEGTELRPFPQGVAFPGCPTCIKPAVAQATMNGDVKAFYDAWKAALIKVYPSGTALAGRHYLAGGANGAISGWPAGVTAVSSSEAHGYLMLVTVLMAGPGGDPNGKTIFDSANALRKALPSSTDSRLMQWVLPSNGSTSLQRQGPATDGDLDMAYALLLAYNQWGDVTYLNEAKTIIAGMEAKFVTTGTGSYFPRLNAGDASWSTSAPPESKPYLSRPSDYMIGHFRAFHEATGNAIWQQLETGSLNILNQVKNSSTGLVPDFLVDSPPVPSTTGTGDEGLCYQCYDYNACRVPWRQAAAVAHYGPSLSKTLTDLMVTWAKGKFGTPSAMKAGATLSGGDLHSWSDSAFTSPMVVGGIVNSAHQTWLNSGWTYMKGTDKTDYYGGSITLLSMLVASGNWWKFDAALTCTPETDVQFCARLGKNCGSVTAADNCGTSRTVTSCGTCTSPATCGGGGTANVCGTAATQQPYLGTARALPGTLQAEHYDTGGQGVAYHDTTAGNSGGLLRTDDVDIGQTCGAGCYNLGWGAAGEWTEYTVTIAATSTFTVDLRTAVNTTGRTMHVEVDGVNETGTIAIPNTASWSTYQTTTAVNIGTLAAGQHVVRVVLDNGPVNVDWIRFTSLCTPETDTAFCGRLGKNCGTVTGPDNCGTSRTVTSCGTCTAPATCGGGGTANVCGTASSQQPYGGTPRAIPGTIQAEDYDTGGQGVAYNDATPTDNTRNAYRDGATEGVDVESKATGQYNIGVVAAGEWVEYTVNATAGAYDLQLRVATTATKTMHVELDGANVSGTINVPNTGSYSTFQTVTVPNLTLTAGQKVMRVVFDTSSINLDWIAFVARPSGGNVYQYLEAESGVGSSTAPMTHVTDANASGGKCIWNSTSSSTGAVPTNGHVTFSFSLAAAGTYKVWGRFLVGPSTSSDDSLWIRIDSSPWIQWNDIYPRIGNAAYGWDAERDTASANALVTRSLAAGNHTLEIAYRENGLKMDRFLVTNDLALTP